MTPGDEEQWTLSVQHTEADIDRYIEVFSRVLRGVGGVEQGGRRRHERSVRQHAGACRRAVSPRLRLRLRLPNKPRHCYIPPMSSPRFEVVAPFAPAGDQPKAIAELTAGLAPRRQVPDPARRHRVGQDDDPGAHHRQLRQADPGPVPQQDPGGPALRRAPAVPAQERGRVLRLLLRLLPARGLRPLDRRVHREGRVDQPGHREPPAPRHLEPDGAGGRRHRRHGQRHLRPGRPGRVPEADGHGRAGASSGAGTTSSASWSASSTAGTTSPSSRAPSASGAIRSRSSRPTPSRPSGSSSGATRSSGSARSTRSPATRSPSSSSAPSTRPSTSSPSGPRSSAR